MGLKITTSLKDRFEAKVIRGTPEECWHWNATTNGRKNYGLIRLNGKYLLAHRVAFFISRGFWPGKMQVCHSCDNPRCVNPGHLWLGTQGDNMQDAMKKGRHFYRDSKSKGVAKLSKKDVYDLKQQFFSGILSKDLAVRYNIGERTVRAIAKNQGTYKGE